MAEVLTLDQVKLFAGLEDEFGEDDRLQQIADGVERAAGRYLGRRHLLHAAIVGERHTAETPTRRLFLHHSPVLAGSVAILVDGNAVGSGVEGEDFLLYYQPGVVFLPQGGLWAPGFDHITVDYTAGFSDTAENFAAAYPDLVHALAIQAAFEFQLAGRKGRLGAESSVVQTGAEETYVVRAWAPGVLRVLDTYKRRRL